MRSKPPTIGMENQLLQLHMANAAAFCAMFRQEPIGYGKWGEWHNCSPFPLWSPRVVWAMMVRFLGLIRYIGPKKLAAERP